jgi:hypothetical protein
LEIPALASGESHGCRRRAGAEVFVTERDNLATAAMAADAFLAAFSRNDAAFGEPAALLNGWVPVRRHTLAALAKVPVVVESEPPPRA